MISLGGGSLGLQIGGQAADLVFLIMNPRGIDYLIKSQFTLGADASVAAGPVGRTGEAGNRKVYGEDVNPKELLLFWGQPLRQAARGFVNLLQDLSPRQGAAK